MKTVCECVMDCRDCSLSGEWHVHPGTPCPLHPDAPGDQAVNQSEHQEAIANQTHDPAEQGIEIDVLRARVAKGLVRHLRGYASSDRNSRSAAARAFADSLVDEARRHEAEAAESSGRASELLTNAKGLRKVAAEIRSADEQANEQSAKGSSEQVGGDDS